MTEGVSYDTIEYTYDTRGNILAKTYKLEDAVVATVSYGYADAVWKDRLTSFDGVAITYDEIGNPDNWVNGETLTWQYGRQLASYSLGDTAITYVYDADGIRTSKTVNNVTTNYTVVDGVLRRMTDGTNTLQFLDNSVLFNGTEYWYVKNAQGDILGLIDANGDYVVEYTYDSWGAPLTKTGTLAATLGTLNPFRYRGYIYDEETGWYYCQSRYYDPEVGRWLNADIYLTTGISYVSHNMFAYGDNSPVNTADYTGEDAIWLQDSDGVYTMGHTGLLLEDEQGVWHHYYWGMDHENSFFIVSTPKFDLQKLEVYKYNESTLLQEINDMQLCENSYEKCIYFEGDFTESIRYLEDIKSGENYNLISNNCMQTSADALLKGTFSEYNFMYKLGLSSSRSTIIPNVARIKMDICKNISDSASTLKSQAKKLWRGIKNWLK